MALRPHDLLVIDGSEALHHEAPCPDWVQAALATAPYVVVRRQRAPAGMVAVGVRGQTRSERYAALLPITAIRQTIAPEQLAQTRPWASSPRLSVCPALLALDMVADALARLALAWGPVGSVGFELANNQPTVTASSDLDVLIRAPQRVDDVMARTLLSGLSSLPVYTDIQVEATLGAFALREYAQTHSRVLLRTMDGPQLVADPWGALPAMKGAEP